MGTTTEQPTTPVCPMTWAELNKKGFITCHNLTDKKIYFFSFGGYFEQDVTQTIDQAAELIWQKFCNFINGRIN